MPKQKKTTRTQPKPISLYDPSGALSYSIDSVAALMEYEKGVPVNRTTAIRTATDQMALTLMASLNIDVFQLEKLVIDWRTRHNL